MKVRAVVKTLALFIGVPLLCLVSGVVGGALSHKFGESKYTLSYADFISIMLTAISLLMTLLAFFLAILAYIGWTNIESKVKQNVEGFLDDGFKDGNELNKMFLKFARKATYKGVQKIDLNFEDDAETEAESES